MKEKKTYIKKHKKYLIGWRTKLLGNSIFSQIFTFVPRSYANVNIDYYSAAVVRVLER
jgi:hypothetical protein